MNLRITTLVEDTAGRRGLMAEHGLSFWIELGERKILFDTGQGLVLTGNARQLGIRLEETEAVIISHGHYDHTGGLDEALRLAKYARVYAHPAAFLAKYARRPDGSVSEIGIPLLNEKKIREQADLSLTEKQTEIGEGLFLTGPVPRRTDFEDVGGDFFTDAACSLPDALTDDQSVFIETPAGTVVILGCAHAGVINTLDYIRALTDNRRIHTVLGGMHLLAAAQTRMHKTVTGLRRIDARRLSPCHCTGFDAMARILDEFPDQFTPCHTGTVFDWN